MKPFIGYSLLQGLVFLVLVASVNGRSLINPEKTNRHLLIGAVKILRSDNAAQLDKESSRNKRESPEFQMAEKPEILINATHSNETSFEDYEKQYLLNKSRGLLEQFLQYDKFLQKLKENNTSAFEHSSGNTTGAPPTSQPVIGETSTSPSRVDPLLEAKLLELSQMSVKDLTNVFHNLRQAAEDGVSEPSIATLCCHIG